MEILLDVLKDSKAHYLGVQAKVLKRLQAIPRGSVQKRRFRRGGPYFYLKFRRGHHVLSRYLGKDEPVQLIKDIQERRLLLDRLKEVRQNLAILNRLRWESPRAKRHR